MIAHLRTHFGIKPFKCSYCNKKFNEKGNLKTHIRIHTGERPFHCNLCSKSFKAFGQLKDHLTSHTGIKPFKCPVCLKNYRRKGILKNHMLIHIKDNHFFLFQNFMNKGSYKNNSDCVFKEINNNLFFEYGKNKKNEENNFIYNNKNKNLSCNEMVNLLTRDNKENNNNNNNPLIDNFSQTSYSCSNNNINNLMTFNNFNINVLNNINLFQNNIQYPINQNNLFYFNSTIGQ